MQNNLIETLIGAAVVIIALIFLTFAYRTADAGGIGAGYTLSARVSNITGITVGTDVRIAGIKVGTVSKLELDPQTYEAVVSLSVEKKIELGEDTSMSVATESLLGGNFIALQPGADFENLLRDGDQIVFATGTVDLLSLIQQAIFGAGGSTDTQVSTSATPPAPGLSAPAPAGGTASPPSDAGDSIFSTGESPSAPGADTGPEAGETEGGSDPEEGEEEDDSEEAL